MLSCPTPEVICVCFYIKVLNLLNIQLKQTPQYEPHSPMLCVLWPTPAPLEKCPGAWTAGITESELGVGPEGVTGS